MSTLIKCNACDGTGINHMGANCRRCSGTGNMYCNHFLIDSEGVCEECGEDRSHYYPQERDDHE